MLWVCVERRIRSGVVHGHFMAKAIMFIGGVNELIELAKGLGISTVVASSAVTCSTIAGANCSLAQCGFSTVLAATSSCTLEGSSSVSGRSVTGEIGRSGISLASAARMASRSARVDPKWRSR